MPRQFAPHVQRSKVNTGKSNRLQQPVSNESETGSPSKIVSIQGTVGNRGAQRMMAGKSSASIQRLMTPEDMVNVAGAPQKDRLFGLKKMSEKYKNVLAALKAYNDRTKVSVEISGASTLGEAMLEQLGGVTSACNIYIEAHKDDEQDTRRSHITRLRDVEVPKERDTLNFIISNPSILERFKGKTIGEAIKDAHENKTIADAVSSIGDNSNVDKDGAKEEYSAYLQSPSFNDTVRQQTSAEGTMPFRARDDLSAKSKTVVKALGQDYVKQTVMPLMGNILVDMLDNVNIPKEKLEEKDHNKLTQDERNQRKYVSGLYGQMVQGLLLNSKGESALPEDLINAASDTFARVYVTTEDNPRSQHTALAAARIAVINMIFLRYINGLLVEIRAKLESDSTMSMIMNQLASMLQFQVNGLDAVKKFASFSESQDIAKMTDDIISGQIDQIIEAGMLKAQLIRESQPKTRARRGAFVIGKDR